MEKPTEDLIIALKSEVLGEAFFRSAYYAALFIVLFSNRRQKAKLLWQLEVQTKKRIVEYFQANQLEIPKLKWTAFKGSLIGVFCSVVPWHFVLKAILQETEYYLEVFRRLKKQASDKDQELFQYIVAHEVAITQFAKAELLNSGKQSLKPIEALLKDPSVNQDFI